MPLGAGVYGGQISGAGVTDSFMLPDMCAWNQTQDIKNSTHSTAEPSFFSLLLIPSCIFTCSLYLLVGSIKNNYLFVLHLDSSYSFVPEEFF